MDVAFLCYLLDFLFFLYNNFFFSSYDKQLWNLISFN